MIPPGARLRLNGYGPIVTRLRLTVMVTCIRLRIPTRLAAFGRNHWLYFLSFYFHPDCVLFVCVCVCVCVCVLFVLFNKLAICIIPSLISAQFLPDFREHHEGYKPACFDLFFFSFLIMNFNCFSVTSVKVLSIFWRF